MKIILEGAMYSTSDFRKGLKIEIDGEPFVIVDFLHVKPGKGSAFVRTKIKSLITGAVFDRVFRSGERFEKPDLEEKEVQFLYKEGDKYHFMDMSTYEEMLLTEDQLGENKNFLAENTAIKILLHNGRPVGVELPTFVELTVVETEPGVKGDTATAASKPAKLESGAIVQVPLFINTGDVIKVDTRTGTYIERVATK